MDLTKLLDAVSSALSVIKTVADTPGVNLIPYVSTVSSAIGAMQTAYSAGKSIIPYVNAIKDTFTGDGIPSEEKLAELDAKIAELEAQVDAPLPPKEEGEEE